MKKSNFLFIQYVLLTITILAGYTHCRCTPPPPQDTSPSSSPADSDNNTTLPTTITQEMIDIVTDTVNTDNKFQFLLDRLQELKGGNKNNIDQKDPNYKGFTALHYAARIGNPSIVAALLKLGAAPTIKDSDLEDSPFIVSFAHNTTKVLETAETFLNDPKVASFINLLDKSDDSPLTRIVAQLKSCDLTKKDDYPKIKELLILREKMIEKGATS
jgi:ankyrin repeat protein